MRIFSRHFVILSFVFFLSLSGIFAQNPVSRQTIFEEFDRLSQEGKGIVIIRQSGSIRNRVGKVLFRDSFSEGASSFVEMHGFRAQVFTGNQSHSKEEAEKRQAMINDLFPELSTYIIYEAPFWRLQVGDYFSLESAQAAVIELKKKFPEFAKEIYVVKEKIKVPL